jgi:uncharacterized protein
VKRLHGLLLAAALAPLRAYRHFVSPALPRRCKYEPTCAAYAEQAIRELGLARGSVVAVWRLARCNPFSHGGYDPLEARTVFRPPAAGRGGADPAEPRARTPEGTMAP